MKYQIRRAAGREIGDDWLIVTFKGTEFVPPNKRFLRTGEKILVADLKTCRTLAEQIGDCFVVNDKGERV